MIVVLGRPALDGGRAPAAEGLAGMGAAIALASAREGVRTELVGSVGDDPEGDRAIVLLGRAGVGHAALLRDPAGHTPLAGKDRGPLPRLEAADIELGLGYLADIRVLILAEPLPPDGAAAALTAAAYHGASVIAIVPSGSSEPAAGGVPELGPTAPRFDLEAPRGEIAPFAEMVGRLAAGLARGDEPALAFAAATRSIGWERAGR